MQGLPLIKPPYGRITAFDMNKGDLVWQIAHGETPDNIKNHPALKGVTIPRTGRTGRIGVLVTKTLVVAGEGGFFTTPNGQRGAMLRAYDKATGNELGVRLHAGAAERHADDVHAERQAVHRARDQRRVVHGGVGGVQASVIGHERFEGFTGLQVPAVMWRGSDSPPFYVSDEALHICDVFRFR